MVLNQSPTKRLISSIVESEGPSWNRRYCTFNTKTTMHLNFTRGTYFLSILLFMSLEQLFQIIHCFESRTLPKDLQCTQAGSKVFDRGGASLQNQVGPRPQNDFDWGPASKTRWGHGPSGPPPLLPPCLSTVRTLRLKPMLNP